MAFDRHSLPGSSGRVLILTSAFAVLAFLVWGYWAEIDQISRASGQVIASSRNQVIQSPDGGVIQEMHVREGDRVKQGQVLISFDKIKTEASYLEVKSKVASLEAALARLNAEIMGGSPKFPAMLDDYPEIRAGHAVLFKKRQSALFEEIAVLNKMLRIANAELDINQPLLASGDVSKADILRLQRQVAEIEGQISSRRNKYLQETQSELSKAQEDLDMTRQVLEQRRDQLAHVVIASPMDGIVRNVRITTRGGVARPGEEIMQIVPADDRLIIEAKVSPSDIGFIKLGLPASIKLDAYDYTIYGIMKGEVIYISADTLIEENRSQNEPPFYRVQVEVKGKEFKGGAAKRIEIQPGMTATVEIKTGSNSVLKYLMKPIVKTVSESMGER
jgi:adhesin transport system membrane fusion protein